jgi:hypothetical protein
MAAFTDDKNDELLSYAKYLENRRVQPVEPLDPFVLQAPTVRESSPLKTAADAILLHDMFAFFLNTGKPGHVITVAGGFDAEGRYHVVGAGNAGRKGVWRPKDELCNALKKACKEFISGDIGPPKADDMSKVLVASLDICHLEVASQLTAVHMGKKFTTPATSNMSTLAEWESWLHGKFRPAIAALKRCLEMWTTLEFRHKARVATLYGQVLEAAPGIWAMIKGFSFDQFERHAKLIEEFNNIATGLHLLRRFPLGTDLVFYWPQGSIYSDKFKCQPNPAPWKTVIEGLVNKLAPGDHNLQNQMQVEWKKEIGQKNWAEPLPHIECKIHSEIYLALYILFSDSDVSFDSFLVAKGKQVFIIGCTKGSCLTCWDILLDLFRQDSHNGPILFCRTRCSHHKCYAAWGPPCAETLPGSLYRVVKGPRKDQMLASLNHALGCSHEKFALRVKNEMLGG